MMWEGREARCWRLLDGTGVLEQRLILSYQSDLCSGGSVSPGQIPRRRKPAHTKNDECDQTSEHKAIEE